MQRHAKALVLVLVMVWQTLAGMTPFAIGMRSEQLQHASVHGQEVGHHHHADASLHLAVDGERSPHVHADELAQPLALAAAGTPASLRRPTQAVTAEEPRTPPSVVLDGLLRPPQPVA